MRTVRLKLQPEVKELLAEKARRFGIDDPGFAEDMFSLLRLKGSGIPDKDRAKAMVRFLAKKFSRSEVGLGLIFHKRLMVLKKLIAMPYFKALTMLNDPMAALERMLATFRSLYLKNRQAQCLTCSYLRNCDFGKQYGATMHDVTKVLDPDYSKKVHKDCPVLPEIDSLNQMFAAQRAMAEILAKAAKLPPQSRTDATKIGAPSNALPLVEEMESKLKEAALDAIEDAADNDLDADGAASDALTYGDVGYGKGDALTGTHSGSRYCSATEAFLTSLTAQKMAYYEIGRKLSLMLDATKAGKFKPVAEIAKDERQAQMTSMSDLTRLAANQHGLPKEVFEARADKKQLVKRENLSPEGKKQLLYLLVDNSGSMGSQIGGVHGLVTRGSLASAFCGALLRRVGLDGGIVFLRFFDGDVSALYEARQKDDFTPLETLVSLASYNGHSTNLLRAINTATTDIKAANAQSELARAEILLITDCEDAFDEKQLRSALQGYETNILDVSGMSAIRAKAQAADPSAVIPKLSNVQDVLKKVATKYYSVNQDEPDLSKMVALL